MVTMVAPDVVKVEPDVITVDDILEYAEAAIEEYGWRKGERTQDKGAGMKTVAEAEGLSLHDATQLADETFGTSFRQDAINKITEILPKGENDVTFNDKAQDVNEIYDVLRKARAA